MRYSKFSEIDWTNWQPKERATLLFVLRDSQVLLIHKKRGLGAGKINAPGGRLENGETPLAAAIRETQEEICVTPTGVAPAGELLFQFVDGFSIHGYVFTATGYTGEPQETGEAIPTWVAADALPYHRMWADDRVWMPLLLQGKKFTGRFLFDGDLMLGCEVNLSA
ncbi:MAG: 8-oxo-dGTP diphosphatase [Verrucomicrobia bacterium]|nr:MAG: 8-oxo-dGTP diphosphatase [Verrucomicrobiota bacterium]